jgi:peptide/nickel transport system substrate-binding protein
MLRLIRKITILTLFLSIVCSACKPSSQPTLKPPGKTQINLPTEHQAATLAPTSTPEPPRVLTICMASEPTSLFLYGDNSVAARSVRQAIYDGPFDILNYDVSAVILQDKPSLANGDVQLEPGEVQPGGLIRDAAGELVSLADGTRFTPSACSDPGCAQDFSGQESVSMDHLVVKFKLRPGLKWSDGSPLTADDSVYSFEVAKALFPDVRSDLISRTQSYQALDDLTVQWEGIPGDYDPEYALNFFTPLPRHAWGAIAPQDLASAEISSRRPLGWGPYQIDEWTPGDHITLSKNPAYFRLEEGLPHFDNLVFRFVQSGEEALSALLAGECDYVDETAGLETQGARLLQLQSDGRLAVDVETSTAWEHADFDLQPLTGVGGTPAAGPSLFQSKETRQAIAMCIDRQRMADELFFGQSTVPDTYVPAGHPLFNPEVTHYDFDPGAASDLLLSAGWVDDDNDPSTPRLARGVTGVPDGTPLSIDYLTTGDDEKQKAAQIVQSSLTQCGVQVNIHSLGWNELLAPGPDGPVFGRQFSMAQFAWITSFEPPCFLYMRSEIPGPYPDYPKGWGGANVSGYSNPQFDQTCQRALNSLPDWPAYAQAHRQAQAIFSEDLPAIPLYARLKVIATRPDMCGVIVDPASESALWNLEAFDYGQGCGE